MRLPLINVSSLVRNNSNVQARIAIAKLIDAACRNNGFFAITGHGIDVRLQRKVLEIGREFFARSEEEKQQISFRNHHNNHSTKGDMNRLPCRGYQKVFDNVTGGQPDFHEAIDFYCEVNSEEGPFVGQNQWPESSEMKAVYSDYIFEMINLGQAMMRTIALGLSLDESSFDEYFGSDPFWIMRVIHYPHKKAIQNENHLLGCGAHTDYGWLTFVHAEPVPNTLQIWDSLRNEWQFVNVATGEVPAPFIVNLGDMLSLWTGGEYKSTKHRVLRPEANSRISIPFFFEPNLNTIIRPLPMCQQNPSAMPFNSGESLRYRDHLYQKIKSNFG